MGASESKSSLYQENDQTYFTKNEFDSLIQKTNNIAAEAITKSAQSCGQSVIQSQSMKFSNIRAKGSINISDVKQDMASQVNFSCVQSSKVAAEISQDIAAAIQATLTNETSNDIKSQMDGQASSSAKLGFAIGAASAETNVTQINKIRQETINSTKLQNITENNVSTTFNNDSVANCINSVNQNQDITFNDLVSEDGSVTIKTVSQEMATKAVAECIQKNEYSTKAVTKVLEELGIKVANKSETKATVETIGKAISEATAEINPLASAICCIVLIILIFVFLA